MTFRIGSPWLAFLPLSIPTDRWVVSHTPARAVFVPALPHGLRLPLWHQWLWYYKLFTSLENPSFTVTAGG